MIMRMNWGRWAAPIVIVLLGGCGTTGPVHESPDAAPAAAVAGPLPAVPEPAPAPAAPAAPASAVVALLDSAATKERAGQLEQAAATLERALRLEPRNAMLWHRLARLRLKQGQWRNAVDFASKSNSLAGGNSELQGWNWAVIAEAKERLGDVQGAAAARAHLGGADR